MSPTKKKKATPRKKATASSGRKTAKSKARKKTAKKATKKAAVKAPARKKAAPAKKAKAKPKPEPARSARKAPTLSKPKPRAKARSPKPRAAGKSTADRLAAPAGGSPEGLAPGRSKLGEKYVCYECGAKFYDLNRPEPLCPKCGTDQRTKPKQPARARSGDGSRSRRASEPMAPLLEEEETVATPDSNLGDEEFDIGLVDPSADLGDDDSDDDEEESEER